MNINTNERVNTFLNYSEILVSDCTRGILHNIGDFINYIKSDVRIFSYITKDGNTLFKVEKEVETVLSSYGTKTFDLGNNVSEVVFNTYKLLDYIIHTKIPIEYLGASYTSSNTFNDKIKAFVKQIICPFIEYIKIFLAEQEKFNMNQIKKIFIVHGHDNEMKLELKDFLQNTLGLPKPIILSEQPNSGMTIIEKFEEESKDADVVFVLLTPDDFTDKGTAQARQNVILELGYFLGKLGRKSGRIIILIKNKGDFQLPSDIKGVGYIEINNHVEFSGEQIRNNLKMFQ